MQRRKMRETLVAWAIALTLFAPMSALAGEWQTYLRDDFSSAQTMFYTGPLGTAYYGIDEDGRYVVDGLSAPGDSMAILTDSLYYYYFEAECEVLDTLAGDLASCGLVFHYNKRVRPGQNSYYVFYVYSDGYYGVKRVVGDSDGKVDILIPLAKTEMIDANYPNVLAVDAQGSRFDLYINGKYVDGFTDLAIDGGGFGFYSTKKTKAAYDNFSVKIERRELGRDNLAQPRVNSPGESTESGFSFEGYSPPVIPKNPNRPLYPWEVGYVDPDRTKKTADQQVNGNTSSEPLTEMPEPEPNPGTSKHNASDGTPHANIINEPTPGSATPPAAPEVELPPLPKASPQVEASGSGQAQANSVQAHSFGDFGYDDNSSEVKLVAAGELKELATQSGHHTSIDDQTAKEKPASIKIVGVPPATAPKITIRPDWLLDTSATDKAGAGGAEENPGASPPQPPETAPNKPGKTPPTELAEPVSEATERPKKEQMVYRNSGGIGGNDEVWDNDELGSWDSRLAVKPGTAKENPTTQEPTQPADDPAPSGENQASESLSGSLGQLSLFPPQKQTAEPAVDQPEVTQPTASLDTLDNPEDAPPKQALSFREAGLDAPPTQASAVVEPPGHQPQTTIAQPVPSGEQPTELPRETNNDTPALETEVVITTSAEPALAPEPEQVPEPKVLVQIPAPEPQGQADLLNPNPTLPLIPQETPAKEPTKGPEQRPQVTIIDDFSDQTWPVADNGVSSYRYFGAAYEIDNRMADTMAIAFQQHDLAKAQYTVESEFLDGISEVGYGLAGHFQVNGGNASYYGLFISHSGEYLLLKVTEGEEKVLVDWAPCNLLKPNMPNIISLEIASPSIKVFINGKLVTTMLDSSLRSGGYALLAGPGVAARFDNLVVNGDPLQ